MIASQGSSQGEMEGGGKGLYGGRGRGGRGDGVKGEEYWGESQQRMDRGCV